MHNSPAYRRKKEKKRQWFLLARYLHNQLVLVIMHVLLGA